MDNMPDDPDFRKFFEAAKPTWQNDNYGIRGNNAQTNREQAPVTWPRATVEAMPVSEAPTSIVPTEVKDPLKDGGGNTVFFSFLLEQFIDPVNADNPKVLIRDVEVIGGRPPGMGTDEYTLDVYDGAFINLIVTYDTSTLAITSLTFAVEADVADPTLGTFRVEIGRTYIDFDVNGHISSFTPVNTQCGDINFQLIYGANNGQPAVIPVAVYSGWVSAI